MSKAGMELLARLWMYITKGTGYLFPPPSLLQIKSILLLYTIYQHLLELNPGIAEERSV